MLVRSRLSLQGQHVARGDRLELQFQFQDPQVVVAITYEAHPNDAEQKIVLIESSATLDPPAEHLARLNAIAEGSPVPDAIALDGDPVSPDAFLDFCGLLASSLVDCGQRAFEILRWRERSDSMHRPYGGLGSQFSLDGQQWFTLPGRGFIQMGTIVGIRLTELSARRAQFLVDSGAREPVAHQLLREALDVSGSNPRSAIVIGIAAAEVGFKQLVAALVPDAEWLISKVPSPPLPKMLKEYLPLLPTKLTVDGSTPPPPKYVRTLLTDGVESRNTIAHAGEGGLHGQLLVDTLEAVRDLLYLFDFYAGQEWAFDELSTRFKEELGS